MKDPKKNILNSQPGEGTNNDLHLTNQEVNLPDESDSPPDVASSSERSGDENWKRTRLDREASPEFGTDPAFENL